MVRRLCYLMMALGYLMRRLLPEEEFVPSNKEDVLPGEEAVLPDEGSVLFDEENVLPVVGGCATW
jgi:hypothetical protein